MSISDKTNWIVLLTGSGGLISLLLAVERFLIGTDPGLSMITAGILLPIAFVSYITDYQNILTRFRSHVTRVRESELRKELGFLYVYIAAVILTAYGLYTVPFYLGICFLIIIPVGALVTARIFKTYM